MCDAVHRMRIKTNNQTNNEREKKPLEFRLKFKFVVSVVWHVFTVKFSPGLALARHLIHKHKHA